VATVDQGGGPKALPPAPVTAEADKPPPPPTPAEQLASADRALAAGRSSDAIAALKSLADAGNAQAQNRLGDLYAEGRAIARDVSAAEGWYERAALQGDTVAQVKLGTMYAGAGGAARNNNLAYFWFGTAARLGATGANAERDRIGALLQPAEREQADKLIESKVARMPKKP
jgi:TPR repeat protein